MMMMMMMLINSQAHVTHDVRIPFFEVYVRMYIRICSIRMYANVFYFSVCRLIKQN